jgi:hypothetical protein
MTTSSLGSGLRRETPKQACNRRFGVGQYLLGIFEPLPHLGELSPQRLFPADVCWQLADEDAGRTSDLDQSLGFEQPDGRLDGAGSRAVLHSEFPVRVKPSRHSAFSDRRPEFRRDPTTRVPLIFSVRHEIQPTQLV